MRLQATRKFLFGRKKQREELLVLQPPAPDQGDVTVLIDGSSNTNSSGTLVSPGEGASQEDSVEQEDGAGTCEQGMSPSKLVEILRADNSTGSREQSWSLSKLADTLYPSVSRIASRSELGSIGSTSFPELGAPGVGWRYSWSRFSSSANTVGDTPVPEEAIPPACGLPFPSLDSLRIYVGQTVSEPAVLPSYTRRPSDPLADTLDPAYIESTALAERSNALAQGIVPHDACQPGALPGVSVLAFPCPAHLTRRQHARRWAYAMVLLFAAFYFLGEAFVTMRLLANYPEIVRVEGAARVFACSTLSAGATCCAIFFALCFWTQIEWAYGRRSSAILFSKRLLLS